MATNYAVHPLSYLDEWLDDLDDNAAHTVMANMTPSICHLYRNPDTPVDDDNASELEKLTGIPASAWMRYQETYDNDRARLASEPDRIIVAPRGIYGELIALPIVKGAVNIVSSTDSAVCSELTSRVRSKALAHSYRGGEPAIHGVERVFDLFYDIVGADDLIDWTNNAFAHAPWNAFVEEALVVCDMPETARIHPTTRVAIMRELVSAFAKQHFTLLITTQDPYVLYALEAFCARASVADRLRATYVEPERGARIHYNVQNVTDNLDVIYKTFAEPLQYLEDIELSMTEG